MSAPPAPSSPLNYIAQIEDHQDRFVYKGRYYDVAQAIARCALSEKKDIVCVRPAGACYRTDCDKAGKCEYDLSPDFTPPQGETPRTDALHARSGGDQPYEAMREHAKQLEREWLGMKSEILLCHPKIAELEAEVAALKHDIERYVQANTDLLNDTPFMAVGLVQGNGELTIYERPIPDGKHIIYITRKA